MGRGGHKKETMEQDAFFYIEEKPGIVSIEFEQIATNIIKSFDGKEISRETIQVTSSGEFRTYMNIKVNNLKDVYLALKFQYRLLWE